MQLDARSSGQRHADAALRAALDALVMRYACGKDAGEVILGIHDGALGGVVSAASGTWRGDPVGVQTPYFLASASKLFATAMIMRLRQQRLLCLDDPVIGFFPAPELAGLHRLRGREHTGEITLRHLLAHSSGLPDYFEGRRRDGTRLSERLLSGQDFGFGLAEVIAWSRDAMQAHFVPGHARRALYSDTNFYLLGEIIARLHGSALPDALRALITGPLGLERTRIFTPADQVLPLRNGAAELEIPKAMSSMPLDGGIVSTAHDMLVFTRAFYSGRIFPAAYLSEMADWRRIFFPMHSGLGMLRFRLPCWLSPFRRAPVLIGHSGISGAFAFHAPERDVTLCGTVNQLASRSRPYRLMLEALAILRRRPVSRPRPPDIGSGRPGGHALPSQPS